MTPNNYILPGKLPEAVLAGIRQTGPDRGISDVLEVKECYRKHPRADQGEGIAFFSGTELGKMTRNESKNVAVQNSPDRDGITSRAKKKKKISERRGENESTLSCQDNQGRKNAN